MKNLDLKSFGVQEMDTLEMQETDGGLLLAILVACAAVALLTSCTGNNLTIQIGGSHNDSNQGASADSTLNGNTLDVPIGY